MISKNLRKTFQVIKFVSNIKTAKSRRKILEELAKDESFFQALREITINCLEGNIKLNKKTKSKLQKNRKIIRALAADQRRSDRKKLVSQTGGILPFLIPAAATALSAILKDVILS